MNKIFTNKILVTALSFFVLIVLMSNSSGRGNVFGQAVTGAPGDSNRTCASSGCHSSGAFSPNAELSITDDDGNTISGFTPGETYNVTLSVQTTGNPSAYGFQMVALLDDESAATDWSEIGNNVQIVEINNRDYIEHESPSQSNEFTTKWTAPEAGSGDVTFYFSANAVNGNGGSSGDGGTNSNFTLSELTTPSSDLIVEAISVYPIPASEFVTISGDQADYEYTLYDISGQRIRSGKFTETTTLETIQLESGLYFINIQSGDQITTKKLIKK